MCPPEFKLVKILTFTINRKISRYHDTAGGRHNLWEISIDTTMKRWSATRCREKQVREPVQANDRDAVSSLCYWLDQGIKLSSFAWVSFGSEEVYSCRATSIEVTKLPGSEQWDWRDFSVVSPIHASESHSSIDQMARDSPLRSCTHEFLRDLRRGLFI